MVSSLPTQKHDNEIEKLSVDQTVLVATLHTTMMTAGDIAASNLGFRGFHRESLNPPTHDGNVLNVGDIPIKIPGYMKRKCFWELSTGWLILKPKNLIPKREYKEYAKTNVTTNGFQFITWPTLKNNSSYAKRVRNVIQGQQVDIDKDLVSRQYSPLYNIWVFHGDSFQGRYKVYEIQCEGIWIKRI